ncbi:ATP-binding protein [Streptomyces sp. WAC08241]|uniref:ATP-binding protein n=1 Tax=Streptomyces sp. WAC08241 TaxID=2487421 RepID=UPI000F7771B2|nr:ATP-binding protein [Streptomyces sp. WAC08241]RSS39674.1 ATP-binding protein [Streptomyces sp. WAC08241]
MAQRPQPQTDTGAVRRFAFELPALTASVARARRLAEERLIIWGCGPEIRDTVSLVVSELVTNAVVHTASGRFVCELREGEEKLRIAVRDEGGPAGPRIRDCGEDERGRGLIIVDALCSAWGAERTGHGTSQTVWAELAHGTGEAC